MTSKHVMAFMGIVASVACVLLPRHSSPTRVLPTLFSLESFDTKQRLAILCCHLDQSIYWN